MVIDGKTWVNKIYLLKKNKIMKQRSRRVQRCIEKNPDFTCFKPAGIWKSEIQKVELLVDEYEAMRLCDIEWFSMQEWAEKMWVSAPTFNRMVNSAHKKLADAIVNWKWIRVYRKWENIWSYHEEF